MIVQNIDTSLLLKAVSYFFINEIKFLDLEVTEEGNVVRIYPHEDKTDLEIKLIDIT